MLFCLLSIRGLEIMLSFHHLLPFSGWCECNTCFCSCGGRIRAVPLLGLRRGCGWVSPGVTKDVRELWWDWDQLLHEADRWNKGTWKKMLRVVCFFQLQRQGSIASTGFRQLQTSTPLSEVQWLSFTCKHQVPPVDSSFPATSALQMKVCKCTGSTH